MPAVRLALPDDLHPPRWRRTLSPDPPIGGVQRCLRDAQSQTLEKVTFTAVAEHTGISRTTLYRNPRFRAVVEEHRSHIHNRHTLTGLAAEISHLRSGLEAVAERVSNQEERLRWLEGRTPRLKAN